MSSPPDLRLIVITDRRLAGARGVIDVVRSALAAGAPAVQIRDKNAPARELVELTRTLLPFTKAAHALLFVNDRLDVALAAAADGVHLGPDDLPLTAARRIAPPPFLIGCSTDDPTRARQLERDGASYIGCGAVFGTTSKDVGSEHIGVRRLDEVARAVSIPVIGIGGVNATNIADIANSSAAGAAVLSAVMAADDPFRATSLLLRAFQSGARQAGERQAGERDE